MSEQWKEVNAESSITWDKKAPVQGLLIEKKEHVGDNDSSLYIIETADGNVSVWGSAVLDNKFSLIKVGSEVKVEFDGKKKNPKNGREYNDYKVFSREVATPDDELDIEF